VSREMVDRIQSDRIGEFAVVHNEPDRHYELVKNASKFEGTSRSFGAVAQLRASLSYLEKVGVPRIEEHTVALAHRLYAGLVKQDNKMFTPPGNRSSIVTFYIRKPAEVFRAAFHAAKIDVTVRNDQVRVSPALFNNADEIDHFLSITKDLS
jgi:selenocysteine lyase/cysteine desulfurase